MLFPIRKPRHDVDRRVYASGLDHADVFQGKTPDLFQNVNDMMPTSPPEKHESATRFQYVGRTAEKLMIQPLEIGPRTESNPEGRIGHDYIDAGSRKLFA